MALYDETMAAGYAHWRTLHSELLDSLVVNGAVRAESCVLELGCGTGNYIRALSERTGCRRSIARKRDHIAEIASKKVISIGTRNRVDSTAHPPPYLEARSIRRKEYGKNRFSAARLIPQKVTKMTLIPTFLPGSTQ